MPMPPRVAKTHAIRSSSSRRGSSNRTPGIDARAAQASPDPSEPDDPAGHRNGGAPAEARGTPEKARAPDADRPDTPDEQPLYLRVRIARESADLSKSQLARHVGVCLSAAVQWELAKGTSPTVSNLARIARATEVAFEWLATGRGSPMLPDESLETNAGGADIGFEKRLLKAARNVPDARRQLVIEFALAIVESD